MRFIRHCLFAAIAISVLVALLFGLKATSGNTIFGGDERPHVEQPGQRVREFRERHGSKNSPDLSSWGDFSETIVPGALVFGVVVFVDKRRAQKRLKVKTVTPSPSQTID